MEHQNQQPSLQPEPTLLERNRYLIKGFFIGFLILLMLIPNAFIQRLVAERQERQESVIEEVSGKWANGQTLLGPVLMIPYTQHSSAADGKQSSATRLAYFLPDELNITGDISPQLRKRSIYEVALYRSSILMSGAFRSLNLSALQLAPEDMHWQEARLLVGISDARGLEEEVRLDWNGAKRTLEAGVPENQVVTQGISTPVAITADSGGAFSVRLALRGSGNFYATPAGKTTSLTLNSTWKHPAFDGSYLPNAQPAVSDSGFSAQWKVLQVSRSYPQQWKDAAQDIAAAKFGVRLVQPTDDYSKVERSVKYALLFIALTFVVFFLIEMLQKKQVHPLQYILVGLALTIFYSLLLSISEYLGFNVAYLIAASATTLLIGLYVWSVYQSGKTGAAFTAALGGLYGYIYILLQLEDYALLFGSVGLFLILAMLMYFSRKVDWYGVPQPGEAASNEPAKRMRPEIKRCYAAPCGPGSLLLLLAPTHKARASLRGIRCYQAARKAAPHLCMTALPAASDQKARRVCRGLLPALTLTFGRFATFQRLNGGEWKSCSSGSSFLRVFRPGSQGRQFSDCHSKPAANRSIIRSTPAPMAAESPERNAAIAESSEDLQRTAGLRP